MSLRIPVVAFVFARGGSKGVPRKNLQLVAGKPLIAHAIGAAQASRYVERVFVSTEDEEIAAMARLWGAEVPFMRPVELAGDDAPEISSWQHALRAVQQILHLTVGTFVSVPATSPLRLPADIDACVEALASCDADIVITVTPARRHPMFNMVVLDPQGYARVAVNDENRFFRRQAAPPVFDMSTVAFVARPEYVLHAGHVLEGRVKTVTIDERRAIDIDTPLDLEIARLLWAHSAP